MSSYERPPGDPCSSPADPWLTLAVLATALVLYTVPIWWALSPPSQWVFDEPKTAQIVSEEAREGPHQWPPRYPPLHRWILHAVFTAALPAARVLARGFDSSVAEALQLIGRGVTVLMAIATLLLVERLGRRLGGRLAGWMAALVWLGVAPQAFYAKTMNLDAPYVAWFALSLLFFVAFRRRGRGRDLVAFALAGGAAILTKDQAYGLYVVPAIFIVGGILAAERARGSTFAGALASTVTDRRLWAAAGALLVQVLVVYRSWNGLGELLGHVEQMTGDRWLGRFQEFPATFVGHLELAVVSWRNLAFGMGWPALLVAVLAIGHETRRWRAGKPDAAHALELLLFPISYYLSFIAVIRYSYDRFMLPMALVLAVFAGRLLASVLEAPRSVPLRRLTGVAVALLLAYGFARPLMVDLSMLADVRLRVEQRLKLGGHAVAVGGLAPQMPPGTERAPYQRYRRRACEKLRDVEFVVLHSEYVWTEIARLFGARMRAGEYGYRKIEIPRFEPPRWLYDVSSARTNLAWINMPTELYRRDPRMPCRAP